MAPLLDISLFTFLGRRVFVKRLCYFVARMHRKAINEMNGAWLGSRAIRTNWATRKPPAPIEKPGMSDSFKHPYLANIIV